MSLLEIKGSPSASIRDLVCGFPPLIRGRRLLLALQAFIDESGAPNHAGVLVLSGFVARAKQWENFSDDWQRILDMQTRLRYFKMNEAVRLKGQFRGWSDDRRDERLKLFYGAIEKHVSFFLSCSVPFKEFDAAIAAMPVKPPLHPYHLAFLAIMGQLRIRQNELGIEDKVDFIFDEQVMERTLLLENWDSVVSATPEGELAFVGRTPIFRDDEDVLPLQAADLLAWLQRARWEEENQGGAPFEPPWQKTKEIPGLIINYDEASIRRILDPALARTIRDLGPPPAS
jgi:Protein of unknown function (DUF3800)